MKFVKLPFDKCYCLHLTEATNRYENLMNQFDKLGIKDQVEIWWTCKRKISTEIGNSIKTLHTDPYDNIKNEYNKDIYGAVFNVSFEFYTIIKQSYLRGFQSILLMEDDLTFIDDFDYERFFNNIPNDYDILRMGYDDSHIEWMKETDLYKNSENFLIKYPYDWRFGGMCLVAFNRKGMKYYIDYMDSKFECADYPLTWVHQENNKKYWQDNLPLNVYVTKKSIIKVRGYKSTIHHND